MQSFLRWAGSKRLLLNELANYWPGRDAAYFEPFAGSACLFFHLEPHRAVISDLNTELIGTYQQMQRDVERVIECFRRLVKGERAYYSIRKQNPRQLQPAEAAARFIYLNRYCFNGLFRTNLDGNFNVPYGPPKRPLGVVEFEQRLRNAARLLKRARCVAADFESIIDRVGPGDFVYLDPPYAVTHARVFAEYLPTSFAPSDLPRLSNVLDRIDTAGAIFLLSYADSPEAPQLSKRWRGRRVASRRNISGFVGARRVASEMLVSNFVDQKL